MRKVLLVLCVFAIMITLSACEDNQKASLGISSDTISEISSTKLESSSKEQTPTSTSSKLASSSSENATTSTITSSKPQKNSSSKKVISSSSKPNKLTKTSSTSSNTNKTNSTSSKSKTKIKKTYIDKLNYTVTDPKNKKGLSNKKYGFSFGIAENGQPHPQSIANQKKFDSFKNVDALALDTKTDEKVMYLTFDNGYEYKNLTADILDTLKLKNVKATFFITLSYAKNNNALVKRMIDEGHIVGNHSANHPSFPALTRKQMAEEIAELDYYLRTNFSYTSPYFRFPAGEYSENALELVTSLGYKSVFWSVAYSDWDTSKQKGTDYAYSTVTSRFHSGAVILLHAVSKDNTKALGKIIDKAKKEGYTFKTLDDYFNE